MTQNQNLTADKKRLFKARLKKILSGITVAGGCIVLYCLSHTSSSSDDENKISVEPDSFDIKSYEKKPRFLVEFKSFKTGEWYPKTETNSKASAYSVASTNSWGRATRIIDTDTNEILRETKEDLSMAAHNGYVS